MLRALFPVLIELGPIKLYSFGLTLAVAFWVCGNLLARDLVRRGLDGELAGSILTAAVLGGVAGAKLHYLVAHGRDLLENPLGSIFSGSGLVAHGGFAGGILACLWVIRRRGAPLLETFDAAAPLLALGYAIGRIGCLLAGDGDYGPPSDLPWAMAFPRGMVPTEARVHPTPIYETVAMGAAFWLLWKLRLRERPAGRLFALWLLLSGIERFAIEFVRINPKVLAGLSMAQLVAVASALGGAVWLVLPARRPSQQ